MIAYFHNQKINHWFSFHPLQWRLLLWLFGTYYALKCQARKKMELISDISLKNNLSDIFVRVDNDHIPVIVTRENGKPIVLLSLKNFNAYQETAYSMSSANNAKRLNEAIEELTF